MILVAGVWSAAMAQTVPNPGPPGPAASRPEPYDQVGQALVMPDGAPAAAHAILPPGSYAEVIALDSGRTILVVVTDASRPGRELELSAPAALELGLTPGQSAPVRVRAAAATGPDLAAFRAGQPAVSRPAAPPALLAALRRKLNGQPPPGPAAAIPGFAPAAPTPRATAPKLPIAAPAPAARRRTGPGYYVQIVALSDPARAQSVARSVGGAVSSAGRLHRVRLGPFDDQRRARAARDAVAGRGYGDARIVRD